jgi:predicted nucleic-acid-binding Zn-ribbon protein
VSEVVRHLVALYTHITCVRCRWFEFAQMHEADMNPCGWTAIVIADYSTDGCTSFQANIDDRSLICLNLNLRDGRKGLLDTS